MESKQMQDQAQYIWNRLDDLAKTDSSAYKKFIKKQLEEQKILTSSPEPKLCIKTRMLKNGQSNQKAVFINICGWKRIPYPKTDEEPVKLMAGKKTWMRNAAETMELLLPVVLNDKMYDECAEEEINKTQLLKLIISFVEQHCEISLSQSYTEYDQVYRGVLPSDLRTLFLSKNQPTDDITNMAASSSVNTPQDVLKYLSSEGMSEVTDVSGIDAEEAMDALLGSQEAEKQELIQEIIDEKALSEEYKKLPEPDHKFTKLSMDGTRPNRYLLELQLPTVSAVSECDLTITKDGAELIVKDKYYFAMKFPSTVSDETATAKFYKKSSHLKLTLPLQQSN